MPDFTKTHWSFHSTLAISWLFMPQKLDNGGAQIIFMIVLVCFCPNPHNRYNKVAAGESLVHLLLTADLASKKSLFTTTNKTVKDTLRVTKRNCVSHEAYMVFLLCKSFERNWVSHEACMSFVNTYRNTRRTNLFAVACCLWLEE